MTIYLDREDGTITLSQEDMFEMLKKFADLAMKVAPTRGSHTEAGLTHQFMSDEGLL